MKTIKVSKATNTQLDWLVAKCEGAKGFRMHTYRGIDPGAPVPVIDWEHGWTALVDTSYTTDPALMQPIIERIEGLLMKRWLESNREGKCQVEIHNLDGDWIAFGPTLLIAAARCYVMSKLGEEVEVPEELS